MQLLERFVIDHEIKGLICSLLKCQMCSIVDFSNKYLLSPCHSGSFCLQCLLHFNCKQCITQPPSYSDNLIAILQNARVRCKYANNGCVSTILFFELQTHEGHCKFGATPQQDFKYATPPWAMRDKPISSNPNLVQAKPFIPKNSAQFIQKEELPSSPAIYQDLVKSTLFSRN